MGRKLLFLGCVAAIASACGDSTSDATPGGAGGRQAAGSGGQSSAGEASGGKSGSAGGKAAGGALNEAGSPAAGESAGGAGAQASGAGGQAGQGPGGGGDGSPVGGGDGSPVGGGDAGEGGTGTLGMAGEAGSSAGSPGVAGSPGEGGAPACVNATARYIAGSLDGQDVDYGVFSGSAFNRNMPLPTLFDWRARVGSDGVLHIWGPGTLASVGNSTTVQAHLVTASEGPHAGTHYCAASGNMQRVDTFRHTATLSDWTELGTCPANPGSGSISGCYEETSGGAGVVCTSDTAHLVGNIGNMAIDGAYDALTVNKEGSNDANYFFAFGTGGLLALSTVSNVGSGYLRLPDDGPAPGLIVCVGTATVTPGALSNRYTFTLGSLGVVGACPGAAGASGSLDGCL